MERTLLLIKPDGLQRGLAGRILTRFEEKGLKIIGLKLMRMTPELAARHYAPHVEKPFYPGLVEYMTSAPIIAAVLEAPRVIDTMRKLMGATFGWKAEPGTIRGDFSNSTAFNLVHGSDSPESAAREIGLFFSDADLQPGERAIDAWLVSGDD
ncbi:MAG: nucleoside-diphosphate kinase [Planctomycetota bacterium]|nr:nucleoside-diphosphate kinase [Planctomycetota bacterium]